MLLVRPIVLFILFGVFCINLTQSESHKNKAETLIKMKGLHKSDHNEFLMESIIRAIHLVFT